MAHMHSTPLPLILHPPALLILDTPIVVVEISNITEGGGGQNGRKGVEPQQACTRGVLKTSLEFSLDQRSPIWSLFTDLGAQREYYSYTCIPRSCSVPTPTNR